MATHPTPVIPSPLQAATASKGTANRQRIVDAALDLFMERGYAETSIGDI
ncbi:MAG: TetR family transcriptional regulator, partial [Betaproteobacteria bacterium]|nr:TetR family transcriptional regulator [Betaproteobacteria bacterium]